MEAAIAASAHPLYKERYQRTKRRLGRQRGAKVAHIELARKLTEGVAGHVKLDVSDRSAPGRGVSLPRTALLVRRRTVGNQV
jgi:hypothetical protein